MAKKYLDNDGLLYFWQKIKNAFVPTSRTVAGHALTGNISLNTSDLTNDSGFITAADVPEGSAASSTTPKMDGTAAVGTETAFARGDHRHPSDTSRAPLASPDFTGTPTAPTAAASTSTTQIATTAFVHSAIDAAKVGAAMFQGTVNSATAISGLSAYSKGWYWVVGTAGTYAGQTCEIGDMIFCVTDRGSSYSAADFSVVQNNLDLAAITNGEIDTIVAS